jgi:hypothetical protein
MICGADLDAAVVGSSRNALASPRTRAAGVIIHFAPLVCPTKAHNRPQGQHFNALASNQVGLPAELKHINKRRKRN